MVKFLAVAQSCGSMPDHLPTVQLSPWQQSVVPSPHMLQTQLLNFLLPVATTTGPDISATDLLLKVFNEEKRLYCSTMIVSVSLLLLATIAS